MKRRFVKMHGLGNDFVIIDALERPFTASPERLRWIGDRRRGIGCDQILIIEPGTGADAAYRVFNADGRSAGQCGNGARCVARYLRDQGRIGDAAALDGPSGTIGVEIQPEAVRLEMGRPGFDPEKIPFDGPTAPRSAHITTGDRSTEFRVLSMGNPHAVIEVEAVDEAPVSRLGEALQADARFPDSVNVGFMQVVDPQQIRLRVFERGVGETLACGSGACAAVVCGRMQDRLAPTVRVSLPGGELEVQWQGQGEPVWLSGPAEYAFEGEFQE